MTDDNFDISMHLARLDKIRKRKNDEKAKIKELYNGGYDEGYDKNIEDYNLHNRDLEGTIFVYNQEEDAKEFLLDCIQNGREWDFIGLGMPNLFITGYGKNKGESKKGNDIWRYLSKNDKVLIYSDSCIIGWAKISSLNKNNNSVNFSDGKILSYLNLKCLMKYQLPQLFINNYFKEDRTSEHALKNFSLIFRGKSIIKVSNEDINTILKFYRRPKGDPCFD